MSFDIGSMTDKAIKAKVIEWTASMFTEEGNAGANINTIMKYVPMIQLYNAELSSRSMRRTTNIALAVSALSLIVSSTALVVSAGWLATS